MDILPTPTSVDQHIAPTDSPEQMPAPAASEQPSGAPAVTTPAALAPASISSNQVAAAIAAMPTPVTSAAIPITASDIDVLEPEWVARADEIIIQTAGDPHAEEEAVEALQVDYLQKRYGHAVKPSD